ncbi:MAG: hypothetical protein P8P77_07970 [Crocinitomicaceae bacterium]|jgi:hypothetical protein|nr:hypothetical protein [Crocinitomicaceae bacterium]
MHKAGQAGVAVLNISANKTSLEVLLLREVESLKWLKKPRAVRRHLFKNNAQINLQMKSDLSVGRFFISYPFRNVSPKIEQKDLL